MLDLLSSSEVRLMASHSAPTDMWSSELGCVLMIVTGIGSRLAPMLMEVWVLVIQRQETQFHLSMDLFIGMSVISWLCVAYVSLFCSL